MGHQGKRGLEMSPFGMPFRKTCVRLFDVVPLLFVSLLWTSSCLLLLFGFIILLILSSLHLILKHLILLDGRMLIRLRREDRSGDLLLLFFCMLVLPISVLTCSLLLLLVLGLKMDSEAGNCVHFILYPHSVEFSSLVSLIL